MHPILHRHLSRLAVVLLVAVAGTATASSSRATAQTVEWEQRMTTSADGTRIAYYQARRQEPSPVLDRPPLIAISGGPGSDHRYLRVGGMFDILSESRPVIMFDQRGTSLSGPAGDAPELRHWAEDVEAIRRALGAGQVDLVGHSFGGLVAMEYLTHYGANVRAVVFMSSSAPRLDDNRSLLADLFPDRAQQWADVRRSLPDRFDAPAIGLFFSMEFVDPSRIAWYEEQVQNYVYNIEVNNLLRAQLAAADYTPTVKQLKQPTLVVQGRFDAVIAPSVGWQLHQLVPNSEFAVIEEAGHLPFAEKPGEVALAINQFLLRLDA